jgi:hypothetical protein
MVEDVRLYLVSANKSRPSGQPWSDDDFDVREGAADGLVVGRIYKQGHSPSGRSWFWSLLLFPARPDDSGTKETRKAAMVALKAQWLKRRFDPRAVP